MYRIAICDDESKILKDIYTKIEAFFRERELSAEYFCTENSGRMMEYLQKEKVDALVYKTFTFTEKSNTPVYSVPPDRLFP